MTEEEIESLTDDKDEAMQSAFREAKRKEAKVWSITKNKYVPCEAFTEILPPGLYSPAFDHNIGLHFEKLDNRTDDLINLPDSDSDKVIRDIQQFWDREKHFRQFGFLWRRGVLLHGPPGGGKTSTIQLIVKQLIERGGVAFLNESIKRTTRALEMFRRIEPKRPAALILEDLEELLKKDSQTDVLSLLDGEEMIDNLVVLATTNYPENLDRRITDRPSRFDIVRKIGMPNETARKVFLSLKNPRLSDDAEELQRWVRTSNGYSVAHLKELIILVEVYGKKLEEATAQLKDLKVKHKSTDDVEAPRGTFI